MIPKVVSTFGSDALSRREVDNEAAFDVALGKSVQCRVDLGQRHALDVDANAMARGELQEIVHLLTRADAGADAAVQFAFKKSWSGTVFMLGVIADAGQKDPGRLDYVDRFTIIEAGSPVKENSNYPLKELFLVDNTCREAFGYVSNHLEPQSCPLAPTPTKPPQPKECYGPECCDPATEYWSDITQSCVIFG